MRPTILTLPIGGGLPMHSYGLAIAVGFALGVVVAAREARRVGLDGGAMLDLLFWLLVAGVLGSRLTFVVIHLDHFIALCAGGDQPRAGMQALADCAAPLRLWEGGLVFYGGALCAAGAVGLFCRRRRWSFGKVADVLAPALALGHAVGRLGCFLAGCCFGRPWSHGVSFPPGSVAYEQLSATARLGGTTPPLHPTQLYEAAGELGIFFLLQWLRRRQRFPGATALTYAATYSALRVVIELFRGDAGRGSVGPLSTAQAMSLVIGATALVVLLRLRRLA